MALPRARLYLTLVLILYAALPSLAGLEVLDAYYRPDRPQAQFNYLWSSGYRIGDDPPNYILSGALCVYLRNTGASAVTIDDVYLQGVSLKRAFGSNTSRYYRDGLAYACSIHIPSDSPITSAERQTLISAGEPVWYRTDPETISPGGTAEVFTRMRVRVTTALSLSIQPLSGSAVPMSITVSDTDVPRVSGFALSPTMNKLYLYFRHPQTGTSPAQILLDGQDITGQSTISADDSMDVLPVVCNLGSPLTKGSFHCFQAVYGDGSRASAGARVYAEELAYGLWGGPPAGATLEEGRAHVLDMGRHSMNQQVRGASGANDFMKSAEGLALLDQLGIWRIHDEPDKAFGRLSELFLCDEPDAGDAVVPSTVVPTYAQLGTLAMSLARRGNSFRPTYPTIPNILNLDSTFKPHNWYVYGQVADIFSADPYYQTRLADSYWTKPHQIPVYSKATYIYGVASVCKAGCEPKPLHLVLNCTRKQDGTKVFRWGTPEEKRIEVYYALAGGTKHFTYWWFTPISPTASGSCGITDEPEAAALWREMGLLGAEARTAGPVLVRSCPAQVSVTPSPGLWVRSLISGLDTLVLVCVNDDYANDRAGTSIRPLKDAQVKVDLPAWLSPVQVFEVDYKGLHDVEYSSAGSQVTLDLGTVNVTRMVFITSDPSLRSTLGQLYSSKFGPNVSQLIPID